MQNVTSKPLGLLNMGIRPAPQLLWRWRAASVKAAPPRAAWAYEPDRPRARKTRGMTVETYKRRERSVWTLKRWQGVSGWSTSKNEN